MNKLTAMIAAALFAASVNASEVYRGLEQGNSDLDGQRFNADEMTGVQPGVGDSVDRYQGWADGNSDLFQSADTGYVEHEDPDIYMHLGDNPDL